mgnify:CR=1 FL=1
MAVVDHTDQALVLGVVYDGPPEAGKTTSVRALARGFGREAYTPEEHDGRTVYFVWLEHTGGRFDGAPIRCQIVSVPGQDRWLHRRLHLLERADVVVFVGDTSAPAWPATLTRLRDLKTRLEARSGPPVGIVFQANRRDAADAISLDVVRAQAGSERVALVESVALDGTGVREAFVFAVRLALDRVREEQRTGALPHSNVEGASEQLLAQLLALDATQPERVEARSAIAATSPDVVPSVRPSAPVQPRGAQSLPSHEVPSGLVWPPVAGRILLREAMQASVVSQVSADGDHAATLQSGYRAHSSHLAWFSELEDGRAALIAWARRHVSAQSLLSKGRCIVLAGSSEGGCRLWQVVRCEPSLQELFIDGCESLIARHAARQLASAARFLAEARATCAANALELPCTLDTISVSETGQATFIGNFPYGAAQTDMPETEQVA